MFTEIQFIKRQHHYFCSITRKSNSKRFNSTKQNKLIEMKKCQPSQVKHGHNKNPKNIKAWQLIKMQVVKLILWITL